MTRDDFYRSKPYEVYDLIQLGFKDMEETNKKELRLARFIMSAMTDTSKIVFDFEQNEHAIENWDEDRRKRLKATLKAAHQRHKLRLAEKKKRQNG
jgi:hypothetical protein